MNEELQEQISTIVGKALELAEQTGDFVVEQAPLLIQEFLLWNLVEAAFWFTIQLIFIIVLPFMAVRISGDVNANDMNDTKILGRYYDLDEVNVLLPVCSMIISTIILFTCVIPNALVMVKIWIAPKIFLIEYFTK
jgi:hypothetical protein